MARKTIYYYLGAAAILITLIYYRSKALQQEEKCGQVSLKSSPMELQTLLGKPVESKKLPNGQLEYLFPTSPLMQTSIRAVFDGETGSLVEFTCGEKVLVRPIQKP